jgi:UbiD family decarboxylase
MRYQKGFQDQRDSQNNDIVVDADVDPLGLNQVAWALSIRTRAGDIHVLEDRPASAAERLTGLLKNQEALC